MRSFVFDPQKEATGGPDIVEGQVDEVATVLFDEIRPGETETVRVPVYIPQAGRHVMRSDWTPEAKYLIADTGPYGGPHGHEDLLSFELFAYGAAFIVDPGSYTYNRTDPYRDYFVSSHGHNTVIVDGGSQVRRFRPGQCRLH